MAKKSVQGGYSTETTLAAILAAIGPGPAAEPVKFDLDGVITDVLEDTGTPANNRPLPVKLLSATGDINITANDLNVALSSANDSVEVLQATHDDLNLNANLQIGNVDVSGANEMPITSTTLLTEVTGAAILVDTSSIDGKTPALGQAAMAASVPIAIASDQSTLPVSLASQPLPSGAATEVTLAAILVDTGSMDTALAAIGSDTSSIDGKTPALGTALIASSVPVNIASDQTVPVSASSLPLPAGASTSALQTSSEAILTTIDADTSTLAGTVAGSEQQVDIVASLPAGTNNIGDVDVLSSVLPSGASTSALQTTGNTSLSNIEAQLPATLGQKAKAASLAVTLASDEDPLELTGNVADNAPDSGNPVKVGGRFNATPPTYGDGDRADLQVNSSGELKITGSLSTSVGGLSIIEDFRQNATTTPFVAGTWVEVDASTSADSVFINVSNFTGEVLEIGTGAAASEVKLFSVGEGGEDPLQIEISSGTRVSVRSPDNDATSGNVIVTILG